jgi:FkbM family methyltransferase
LKNNIKINKFKNITASQLALSDKEGYTYLYEAKEASTIIRERALSLNYPRKIQVKMLTLDKYLKDSNIGKVDFIKIDVEGAEKKVLRGARKILSRDDGPDLLVEVTKERSEIIEELKHYSYIPYYFTKNGEVKRYKNSLQHSATLNMYFKKR